MRVESPFGAHFIFDGWNAPNDREEDRKYAQMTRVREWDRIYHEAYRIDPPSERYRSSE